MAKIGNIVVLVKFNSKNEVDKKITLLLNEKITLKIVQSITGEKVLFLLNNEYRPDVRVKKEIESLIKLGFYIQLFCWDINCQLPKSENYNNFSIRRIQTPSKKQLGYKQLFYLLKFYLKFLITNFKKKIKFDIIHVHDLLLLPLAVLLKILYKKPLIYDAHEIYVFMEAKKFNKWILKIIQHIECLLIKYFVDEFITVSTQRVNEYWLKKIPKLKYTVVGNWHNILNPAKKEETLLLKKELQISPNKKIIGYIGSISPSRNIKAFCDFLEKNQNYYGIIAGRGAKEEESILKRYSDKNDNIKYLGYIKNPNKIYSICDALIYLIKEDHKYSDWIAPNNLYTAIAYTKPLISLNKGEVRRVFNSNPIGYCVANYSYSELLKATKNIFDESNLKVIKNNIKNIQQQYTWDNAEKELITVYKRIIL
jgi:hypothetical protein